jgi:hypothetical protein
LTTRVAGYNTKHSTATGPPPGLRESLFEPGTWQDEMVGHCYSKLAVRPRKGDALLFYSQVMAPASRRKLISPQRNVIESHPGSSRRIASHLISSTRSARTAPSTRSPSTGAVRCSKARSGPRTVRPSAVRGLCDVTDPTSRNYTSRHMSSFLGGHHRATMRG